MKDKDEVLLPWRRLIVVTLAGPVATLLFVLIPFLNVSERWIPLAILIAVAYWVVLVIWVVSGFVRQFGGFRNTAWQQIVKVVFMAAASIFIGFKLWGILVFVGFIVMSAIDPVGWDLR